MICGDCGHDESLRGKYRTSTSHMAGTGHQQNMIDALPLEKRLGVLGVLPSRAALGLLYQRRPGDAKRAELIRHQLRLGRPPRQGCASR